VADGFKVALFHDWAVLLGGAEKVLAELLEIWPEADVYTLVYDSRGPCSSFLQGRRVETSFIQKLPQAVRNYRLYLPFMPLAVEQFDLTGYDLVISSSHAVAKGVLTNHEQLHISYVHTPIRYAWEMQGEYLTQARMARGLRSYLARAILHYIRIWDLASAGRADWLIANSQHTARRIQKIYHRPAEVIYPPVDVDAFRPGEVKDDFYLTASRLVLHKRVDLIVEAFTYMPDRKLVIIGEGPELKKIAARAGRNIQFLGYQPFPVFLHYMQRARAFIFAALEDFGITPLEAQACGTPVIAYRKGGALETVIEGKTGLFFDEQTSKSLAAAIRRFENGELKLDVDVMRLNAERFSRDRFQRQVRQFVEKRWSEFK
jgi:glycosyltransferase involved in cell wall biosynthesis